MEDINTTQVRVLPPNAIITYDYRFDRVNYTLNDKNVCINVHIGWIRFNLFQNSIIWSHYTINIKNFKL